MIPSCFLPLAACDSFLRLAAGYKLAPNPNCSLQASSSSCFLPCCFLLLAACTCFLTSCFLPLAAGNYPVISPLTRSPCCKQGRRIIFKYLTLPLNFFCHSLSVCLSVSLYLYIYTPFAYLFACLSIYLSIYLCIYVCIHPRHIHIYIYVMYIYI